MVTKKILRNIGVFALTAMLAVSPVVAVNANPGAMVRNSAVDTTTTTTDEPSQDVITPCTPSAPATSTAPAVTTVAPAVKDDVTLADGSVVSSTVPGRYIANVVDGVAITTPAVSFGAALGAASGSEVYVSVCDTACGPMAQQSVKDGMAGLATAGVNAINGPVIDIYAYVNNASVIDANAPVELKIGVPASFKQEGYDVAIICVQYGGRVSVLVDKDADPNTITCDTKGFGVFAMVKAPAGSFDRYK